MRTKTIQRAAIREWASVVGVKEGEGPLAKEFDIIQPDTHFGAKTWEMAESNMQEQAVRRLLDKASVEPENVDMIFAGDLLNQCAGSAFGLRSLGIPFLGLYGACSTMAEGLIQSAFAVDSGHAALCLALTSSHFCSSERQFRMPLEYGGIRPPTAQWTVTGAGAALVADGGEPPYIRHVTPGKIVDMGITDVCDMGAAMAPAAIDTLFCYFNDTRTTPESYDLIVTGDLAAHGMDIVREQMGGMGMALGGNYNDCGVMMFSAEQQVEAGGSGCGCSAVALCGYILNEMRRGNLREVLFVGTGALMSPTTSLQGESIPSIAHLVHLSVTRQ